MIAVDLLCFFFLTIASYDFCYTSTTNSIKCCQNKLKVRKVVYFVEAGPTNASFFITIRNRGNREQHTSLPYSRCYREIFRSFSIVYYRVFECLINFSYTINNFGNHFKIMYFSLMSDKKPNFAEISFTIICVIGSRHGLVSSVSAY